MSGKAYECKVCKSKELYKGAFCKTCHRDYQTNNMRASRSAKKAMAARANGNRPNMTIQPQAPEPERRKRGQPKATVCKQCDAPPERGAYCMTCWREHASKLRYGADHEYKPAVILQIGDDCPRCGRPIEQKHPNFALCHTCGVKKATAQQRQRRAKQRRPPSNPIIVEPKTHRAPGQSMAPPAPRIEVKPEPVVIPPGKEPRRTPLNISRWSHGGDDLWTPKEVG